jgi:RNA methyltransferase, RsmD family
MRIIAGKYKRTNLASLSGNDITRPSKDMLKEALFSSINIYSDTYFLDLFSGSGAVGIEALSRGAKEVVFNDINKEALKIIKENLNKVNEKRIVYNLDYQECLNNLKMRFDYIFLDPPYVFKDFDNIFDLIKQNNLLSLDGIVIVEVNKDMKMLLNYGDLSLFKERKYGISKLYYYRKEKEND